MSWSDLIYAFLFGSRVSPWMQLGIVAVILTVTALVRRLSVGDVMAAGIIICFWWMPLSMLMSLWTEAYWVYLLNWFLVTLCFFGLYFFSMHVCEKYGRPYTGDGAMVMILPIYLFPVTVFGSLIIRAILSLIQWVATTYFFKM